MHDLPCTCCYAIDPLAMEGFFPSARCEEVIVFFHKATLHSPTPTDVRIQPARRTCTERGLTCARNA